VKVTTKQLKGKQKARESDTNSIDSTNYSWDLGVKT